MDLPKRKPNRLKNYDYASNGAYFITICTANRRCILSVIVGDGSPVPKLTKYGSIVQKTVQEIHAKYPTALAEKFVIMPNHIHIILMLSHSGGTGNPSPTLGNIVGWFKYTCTKRINQSMGTAGVSVFQRSYHDHVIRSEADYLKIWQYIDTNPIKWKEDCFYSDEAHEIS